MVSTRALISAAFLVAAVPFPASALTVFSGQDIMTTTTDAHPNSAAAATALDAAVAGLGGGSLVDFESAPLGSFTNLTIAPGVTISGTDLNGQPQTIRNTTDFPPAPTLDGYNTTSGGSTFVEVIGGTLTFNFATPVYAFGAYFSGIQTAFFPDVVTFSDGTAQSILIPGTGTNNSVGALSFVGFTDAGKAITSITLNAGSASLGADAIGVDDVRFAVAAVPETATWAMMIVGFGAVGAGLRRRRQGVRFA